MSFQNSTSLSSCFLEAGTAKVPALSTSHQMADIFCFASLPEIGLRANSSKNKALALGFSRISSHFTEKVFKARSFFFLFLLFTSFLSFSFYEAGSHYVVQSQPPASASSLKDYRCAPSRFLRPEDPKFKIYFWQPSKIEDDLKQQERSCLKIKIIERGDVAGSPCLTCSTPWIHQSVSENNTLHFR